MGNVLLVASTQLLHGLAADSSGTEDVVNFGTAAPDVLAPGKILVCSFSLFFLSFFFSFLRTVNSSLNIPLVKLLLSPCKRQNFNFSFISFI